MKCEPLVINGYKYYSVKHIHKLKYDYNFTWEDIGNAYGVSRSAVCRWYHLHKNTPIDLLDAEEDFKAIPRGNSGVRFVHTVDDIPSVLNLPTTDKMEDSYYEVRQFFLASDYMWKGAAQGFATIKDILQKIYQINLIGLKRD